MSPEDNKQGPPAPPSPETVPAAGEASVSHEQRTDATGTYDTYYDDYGYEQPYPDGNQTGPPETAVVPAVPAAVPAPETPPPPPPPSTPPAEEPEDDDGMLRMSFLEHLEELRTRLIQALMGMGVAFVGSLFFADRIWTAIREPATQALKQAGAERTKLIALTPTESFSILWVKIPVLAALFIASPWILYQVWSFVAPGLYKHERRWAAPFIISSASLFIIGGLFAYYVAFPLGLAFLLGIGVGSEVEPMISIAEYFDLFFNVTVGMGAVFELPILIFFLSLLRIVTPHFLVRNSRYAILLIVIVAAVITPTPDVINLMLISVPMIVLYFSGVLASYLLWLSRENQKFPWMLILLAVFGTALVLASFAFAAVRVYGFKLVTHWPYLVK